MSADETPDGVDDLYGRAAGGRADPYRTYRLRDAVGVRPSVLKYQLPLDDAMLRRVAAQAARSRLAGRRLGHEWKLARASAIQPRAEDDAWIPREALKPLDDVCTKFCTHKFFPDAAARVNMVANVLRLYRRARDAAGLRHRIIFKGGVMMRLLLLQFWQAQPIAARHAAIRYLHEQGAIGMGDFDFEIVPDQKAPAADAKYRMLLADYAILLWLQREMDAELHGSGRGRLLDASWDVAEGEADLRRRLQAAVDELPATHPMHGATVDHVTVGRPRGGRAPPKVQRHRTRAGRAVPAARRNLVTFECDDTSRTACVADARDVLGEAGIDAVDARVRGDRLYATLSTYINEHPEARARPGELRPLFHLARIKHTFTMYYTTRDGARRCDRLAGEMVDLSTGDPRDEPHAWKHEAIGAPDDEYREYPLLGVAPEDCTLRSYSPRNFLKDHEAMLHAQATPPWDVPKYAKRVVRYAAWLVACVMAPEERAPLARKRTALAALLRYVADPRRVRAGALARTGVPLVDAFARRERAAFAADAPEDAAAARRRAADRYLATLHGHLLAMVTFHERALQDRKHPPPFRVLNATDLDHMTRHIFT